MMKAIMLVLLYINFTFAADKPGALVSVELSPAGSFQIQARVSGFLTKKNNMLVADKITASVSSFKTGMDLRDDHTKEKLKYKKYTQIEALNIKAQGGKGSAILKIMEIQKPVSFTYSDIGSDLARAKFKINLKDYAIGGINFKGVGVDDKVEIEVTLKKK